MPIIKVQDIAWGRMRAPDLDKMEEFLTDFGMVRAERTPKALYMRGTDPAHHIHITEKGDPLVVGWAYYAAGRDDLEKIARLDGASKVEPIDEPGGGYRVRLNDPDGFEIEVVHGVAAVAPLPVQRITLNRGSEKTARAGALTRLKPRASQVKRVGHSVILSKNLKKTLGWYRDNFGFISSDDIYAGNKENIIASLNRCDRGEEYVDHHVLFAWQSDQVGLNHLSFEVEDVDDVMLGHQYLIGKGKYEHMWGVGRHELGAQIFDYWCDPWGRVHEHWTDTDVLNAANGSNLAPVTDLRAQWGDDTPQKFKNYGVR